MVKPKIICVTGGKGGTGKTLVAVNLAIMFKNQGYKVLLIDGDVENPNTFLLLNAKLKNKSEVLYFLPKIIEDKCNKCGLCAENCGTHALLYIKDSYPIPISTVCSGCKLCYKICPTNAIEPDLKVIGWTYTASAFNSAVIVNKLMENLEEVIEKEPEKYDIVILDTAPGAHCDVEELINGADFVIPVTEPTRFGKLDLLRIIELINLLKKEYKAIVNRSSLLGYKEKFLKELDEKGVEVLGDIPLDEEIVSSYCQGIPLRI
ncbi:MAG: nucleotide-binding protein [Promethearchaeota archaeon]